MPTLRSNGGKALEFSGRTGESSARAVTVATSTVVASAASRKAQAQRNLGTQLFLPFALCLLIFDLLFRQSSLARWLRRIPLRHSVLLDLAGLDFGPALLRGAGAGGKASLEQEVHRPIDGNSHHSRLLVHPAVTVQRRFLRRLIMCEVLDGGDLQARRRRQRPHVLKRRGRRTERLAHLEIMQYTFTRQKSRHDEDDQCRAEPEQSANIDVARFVA